MQTRNKLYLENFALLNVEPAVSITMNFNRNIAESSFTSILSLCKQLYIKEIYIKIHSLQNKRIIEYLKKTASDHSLFEENDFKFFLGASHFHTELINILWRQERNSGTNFLMPLLIHTKDFEIQQYTWEKEFVRFFKPKPEIYNLTADKQRIQKIIPNPHNVKAIFATTQPDDGLNYTDLQNITEFFNHKSGLLKAKWKNKEVVRIFVLRQIGGWINSQINLKFDYLSPIFWKTYLNYFENQFEKYLDYFDGFYFEELSYQCHEQCIPINAQIIDNFKDTTGKDFFKAALAYWHELKGASAHFRYSLNSLTLKNIEALVKSDIFTSFSENGKMIRFIVDEPVYENNYPQSIHGQSTLFTKFLNNTEIILQSDFIHPGGHYTKYKQTLIKLISSICHHYSQNDLIVRFGELLNFKSTFQSNMWIFHWLFSLGVTKFNLEISNPPGENSEQIFTEIHTHDPSYQAYFEWYAYINQLAHFLRVGIHRADVLVLYPAQSMWCGGVSNPGEIIDQLRQASIDFDLIDFNSFLDTTACVFDNGKIFINQEVYSFLILPGVEKIPVDVLKRIYEYYAKSGIVIAIGNLPSGSCEWDKDTEIQSLANEIWFEKPIFGSTKFKTNKWGGKGYFQSKFKLLPDIILENDKLINFKIQSNNKNLRSLIRELPTAYHVFLFNEDTKVEFEGTIQTRYKGLPFKWNFNNAEPEKINNWWIKNSFLNIPVEIPPAQVTLLLIKKTSLKDHPQVFTEHFSSISKVEIEPTETKIDGTVKHTGDIEATVKFHTFSKTKQLKVRDVLPTLKISDSNWHISAFGKRHFKGALGDLSIENQYYSGKIEYRKNIVVPKSYLKGYRLFLDLGKIYDWVKIKVNDHESESIILPPFNLEVTNLLIDGENKFVFEVFNSLSNRFSQIPGAIEKGFLVRPYGLFGPVRIIPHKIIRVKY